MSLLVHAYLLEKYGPLLTVAQLSEVLHLAPGTVRNQLSARTLGIPVIRRGQIPYFHSQDVAVYLDKIRTTLADRA
ncbi:hypothetical protein [Aromatoleum anaerobium]|uniref:Helix-turn-helix domain-containing protein n=1 Tax=Aromatoleum anaerobium TaxID=182180 RepID=A0ABX1PSS5_9RHOO|nr:hypothetical protein [Aromatoleum anaerobium]MCK0508462.1 helix-turn-helix domain-containing protein [Aromatoleum anaerobium]